MLYNIGIHLYTHICCCLLLPTHISRLETTSGSMTRAASGLCTLAIHLNRTMIMFKYWLLLLLLLLLYSYYVIIIVMYDYILFYIII